MGLKLQNFQFEFLVLAIGHDTVMKELDFIKKQQIADKELKESQHKIISELKETINEIHKNIVK